MPYIAPDARVRQLLEVQDHVGAIQLILQSYGGEILKFLVSRTDAQLGSDAFAVFSEDLHRGLPAFAFRSSLRTWVYALAYHALVRTRRAYRRQNRGRVSISEAEERSQLHAQERSPTPFFLKTDTKARLAELKRKLPEADQLLLDLRISRRFAWDDIARITLNPDRAQDPAHLSREAARLRKRFQLVKEKLRTLAEAEGIIEQER
jgi:RNA polymerase sigma-70 factor (ECF subfamily)